MKHQEEQLTPPFISHFRGTENPAEKFTIKTLNFQIHHSKMRSCRKSLHISSQFIRYCTIKKPYSSSSSAQSLSSINPVISHEPTSEILKNVNYRIPISDFNQSQDFISKTHLIDVLLSKKNEPLSALEHYYNWAEKQPGGFSSDVDVFCVLFHILWNSDKLLPKRLLKKLVLSLQCSDVRSLINCFVGTADKFGFDLKCDAFHSLLYGFKLADRINDAVDFLVLVLESKIVDVRPSFGNCVLRALVTRNRVKEAEDLFDKIVSIRVLGCSITLELMMRSLMDQGRVKEAVELFINARKKGIKLDENPYNAAVEIHLGKQDYSEASDLLNEMKENNLKPSKKVLRIVSKACSKQDKSRECLNIRDEVLLRVKSLNLEIVMSLMKDYCMSGDLERALSLFARMSEEGVSPNDFIFEVLIEGCCRKGNVEKACELYDQMVERGIQPSVYTSVLMIKKSPNPEFRGKAFEQFEKTAKSVKLDVSECNLLMSWLCKDGQAGETHLLWEKIVSSHPRDTSVQKEDIKSAERTVEDMKSDVVTYTILMEGFFKEGKVEEAFKTLDEMLSQKICTAYTYNTIIRGLCELGQISRARSMLQKFTEEENFKPPWIAYNYIIVGLLKEGATDSAMSLMTEMSTKGVSPNVSSSTMLVKELCKMNKLGLALKLREEMASNGFEFDVQAYQALIDGFRMKRDMKNAYSMFLHLLDSGLTPDDHIYNSMISGYRNLSQPKKKKRTKIVK